MSGGSLDYFYSQLNDHVGDFKDKELDDLVSDLAQLFHDREWYLSGDTGEGSWNEARDNFKAKWFTEIGRQVRIEKYLDDIKTEVLQSFGIAHKYCQDCKNWKKEDENYGRCPFVKGCSFHKCETCEKWEKK
jgi:hypothetical protein